MLPLRLSLTGGLHPHWDWFLYIDFIMADHDTSKYLCCGLSVSENKEIEKGKSLVRDIVKDEAAKKETTVGIRRHLNVASS